MTTTLPHPTLHPTSAHRHPAEVERSTTIDPCPPLEVFEETAFDLATEAGERIVASLRRPVVVSYRDAARGIMAPHDPVSQVDVVVEEALRRRVAVRHPDHAFLGEERGWSGPSNPEFVWVVDPVDGTQNFVNGLPLYASSVALLHHGVPVAGATWCASTHALRPGVYHAREGGALRFDGVAIPRGGVRPAEGRLRGLGTAPMTAERRTPLWDYRSLGSSAAEAAYVAAGLLMSAHSPAPHAWDVAAGVVLARASGREVWTAREARWAPFEGFGAAVAGWRQPTLFASPAAVTSLRPGLL